MSDSGEGLVDAEARLQEQIDAREEERRRRATASIKDPERMRARESLRLAMRSRISGSAWTRRDPASPSPSGCRPGRPHEAAVPPGVRPPDQPVDPATCGRQVPFSSAAKSIGPAGR
jgi:hypothetical protein